MKKIVIIRSSETRNDSYTGFALDVLAKMVKAEHGEHVVIKEHHLGDVIKAVPTAETLYTISPELGEVVDDFFNNDLLLIGTPIKNFAPSVLLQIFFQKMRHKLLTFENDKVVSRNFSGKNVMFVISGVSSIWKWRLMNRFVFFIQFDMLFDFWGPAYNDNIFRLVFRPQNHIRKMFIPNARKGNLEKRKEEITARVKAFARRAGLIGRPVRDEDAIITPPVHVRMEAQSREAFLRGVKLYRARKQRTEDAGRDIAA